MNEQKRTYIEEFKEFALAMLKAAGPIIARYYRGKIRVDHKIDGTPVTAADRECEGAMREMIGRRFPSHGILGEEMGLTNKEAEYCWVLDPIDGTQSFISGGFDFGTLIGLLKNGQPILGAISQPLLGQVMIGDNQTCTFNQEEVHVGSVPSLSEARCLITDISLPARFQREAPFRALLSQIGELRTWGNCFGYTLLARGLADVMLDPIMSPWDLLPLIPVIRGAGGIITDYHGNDPLGGNSIIAASPGLHAQVVSVLNPGETAP